MIITYIHRIGWFIGLVLLQVLILNSVHIAGYAAATVLLAFLRPSLLRLFMPRDNPDSLIPSFKTMGISPFLKYTTASVFVHSLALLSIEFFSFTSIWLLLLRVLLCTILTVTCIIAIEGIKK